MRCGRPVEDSPGRAESPGRLSQHPPRLTGAGWQATGAVVGTEKKQQKYHVPQAESPSTTSWWITSTAVQYLRLFFYFVLLSSVIASHTSPTEHKSTFRRDYYCHNITYPRRRALHSLCGIHRYQGEGDRVMHFEMLGVGRIGCLGLHNLRRRISDREELINQVPSVPPHTHGRPQQGI